MAVRTDKNTERALRVVGEAEPGTGAPVVIESSAGSHGENSVEKSLEDFIARANSMFLDADGWNLGAEEKLEAAAVQAEVDSSPRARTEEVPAMAAPRAPSPVPTSAPVQVPGKVTPRATSPTAVPGLESLAASTPAMPEPAVSQALEEAMLIGDPTKKNVLPTSWLKLGGAFVVGAIVMFVVANKLVGGGAGQPAATAPAITATPPPVTRAVETLSVPTPTPTAARPAPAPPAALPAPAQPAAAPAPVAKAAMAPMPAIEVVRPKAAPAPARVVLPARPRVVAAPAAPVAKPKAPAPKVKGGITDPFADSPSAPQKTQKPKKASGGIVDPFAM
jgi:hypothetical protein